MYPVIWFMLSSSCCVFPRPPALSACQSRFWNFPHLGQSPSPFMMQFLWGPEPSLRSIGFLPFVSFSARQCLNTCKSQLRRGSKVFFTHLVFLLEVNQYLGGTSITHFHRQKSVNPSPDPAEFPMRFLNKLYVTL